LQKLIIKNNEEKKQKKERETLGLRFAFVVFVVVKKYRPHRHI
jgi:hypothetical protein